MGESKFAKITKAFLLETIKFYQFFISPGLGKNCRFYPSCSLYAKSCLEKHGVPKGLLKSFWRVLRCNPFNKGGVDIP